MMASVSVPNDSFPNVPPPSKSVVAALTTEPSVDYPSAHSTTATTTAVQQGSENSLRLPPSEGTGEDEDALFAQQCGDGEDAADNNNNTKGEEGEEAATAGGAAATAEEGRTYRNLFVSRLPLRAHHADLTRIFGPYGGKSATVMLDAKTGRSKGFGFVLFDTEAEGKRAHENLNKAKVNIGGVTIALRTLPSKHNGGGGVDATPVLYVRNVPNTVPKEEVERMLEQFGSVAFCAMREEPDGLPVWVILVEYDCQMCADNALSHLRHNTTLYPKIRPPVIAKYAKSMNRRRHAQKSNATPCPFGNSTNNNNNGSGPTPTGNMMPMVANHNGGGMLMVPMQQQQQQQQPMMMYNNTLNPPPPAVPMPHGVGLGMGMHGNGLLNPPPPPPPPPMLQQQFHQQPHMAHHHAPQQQQYSSGIAPAAFGGPHHLYNPTLGGPCVYPPAPMQQAHPSQFAAANHTNSNGMMQQQQQPMYYSGGLPQHPQQHITPQQQQPSPQQQGMYTLLNTPNFGQHPPSMQGSPSHGGSAASSTLHQHQMLLGPVVGGTNAADGSLMFAAGGLGGEAPISKAPSKGGVGTTMMATPMSVGGVSSTGSNASQQIGGEGLMMGPANTSTSNGIAPPLYGVEANNTGLPPMRPHGQRTSPNSSLLGSASSLCSQHPPQSLLASSHSQQAYTFSQAAAMGAGSPAVGNGPVANVNANLFALSMMGHQAAGGAPSPIPSVPSNTGYHQSMPMQQQQYAANNNNPNNNSNLASYVPQQQQMWGTMVDQQSADLMLRHQQQQQQQHQQQYLQQQQLGGGSNPSSAYMSAGGSAAATSSSPPNYFFYTGSQ